jgi:hypothetical protein
MTEPWWVMTELDDEQEARSLLREARNYLADCDIAQTPENVRRATAYVKKMRRLREEPTH